MRLLGQIGRRGYDVLGVRAELSSDGKTFDVVVEFQPFMPVPPAVQQARPAEVLPALVAKLVEVEKVELRGPGAAAAPPATKAAAPAPKSKAPSASAKATADKPGKAGDMHFLDE